MRLTAALILLASGAVASPPETEIRFLSGTGKDDPVAWEFFCTGGRRSGEWTTIPVPSCWELHGFGTYNYGHDPEKATEDGLYRRRFDVPGAWKGRRVFLVFEGAMTDTEAQVNGRPAGPRHQGAFYRFQYDVTQLLEYGATNLLDVTVSKDSSDASVNAAERQADYWIFGGIFRPVYLKTVPPQHVQRAAIDARADGRFEADVFLGGMVGDGNLTAQILDPGGQPLGRRFSTPVRKGQAKARLATNVADPLTWTAEAPNLHHVRVSLEIDGRVRHTVTERFGFRTVELRPGDGLYVNGRKVKLRGVNRHSFWPDSGRTTSAALSRSDVALMKAMNMNAVRMSHYPPDTHFLDACDELGLYVLDELAGWQAPPYDSEIGARLVREMVERDVNHPSVLFWDNGNEGGWNPDLDDHFALHDPQRRAVLHPSSLHDGVSTGHYPDYATLVQRLQAPVIEMPTELLHGLFDGGGGAGLDDLWRLIHGSVRAAGAFLWSFCDEAVVRADKGGVLDASGNDAPDGVLGPYREKEASYFTIRELWSPIAIDMPSLPDGFSGEIPFENRYDFTNAARCAFEWRLGRFRPPSGPAPGHEVLGRGAFSGPSVPPGGRGVLALPLPPDWRAADVLYLSATGPDRRLLHEWSWRIRRPDEIARRLLPPAGEGRASGRDDGQTVELTAAGVVVRIDKGSGKLASVRTRDGSVSLTNGPIVTGKNLSQSLRAVEHYQDGRDHVVEATYDGNLRNVTWRMLASGWLQMRYRGWLPNREDQADHDAFGLTFSYPQEKLRALRWLGKGPYRVWKNRGRGLTDDVWEKAYNDTETGVSWAYPEFKGYHGSVCWALLRTTEGDFVIATQDDGRYLRILTPRFADAGLAAAPFPPGDVSILHVIPPIGNKFQPAVSLGPEGRKNLVHGAFSGTLLFGFASDASEQ